MERATETSRPLPSPSPDAMPFWEGCRRHELMLPFCRPCQRAFFYPRALCPHCGSDEIEWRRASGRGRLYSYAIQHRAQVRGFEAEVPYITALVELDEGPRMMTNLVEVEPDPERIRCDAPVEVVFTEVAEGVTLPLFRLVEQGEGAGSSETGRKREG